LNDCVACANAGGAFFFEGDLLMTKHFEAAVAQTADWLSPPEFFNPNGEARPGIKLVFDLDVASPGPGLCYVPARRHYTKADNGLILPWFGTVYGNPPFNQSEGAKRNGIIPWLVKFFDHGNCILLVRAQTACSWWHDYVAPNARLLCFVKGKTKFHRSDGSVGKQPTSGVVLIGAGDVACNALLESDLGHCCITMEPDCAQLPLDWRGRAA
jgi:hypothetical protein